MDRNTQQKSHDLEVLYAQLEKDAPHLPLAKTATDIVPGEGPSSAEVLFIGEAPGYFESVERRPFVGKSGQLFRKILETESGIKPEQVYISNIVKVRPPDNRDPSIEELAAYKKYLDAEIEILKPELIVTLGRFSMGKFLPSAKISQVHGKLHKVKWDGFTSFVLPMYHPAAALRSTATKQAFTTDFKKIPKIIAWIKEQKAVAAKQKPEPEPELTPLQKEFAKSDKTLDALQASVIEHLF
ncbi:MAG: uracil-DNA glycosylase [Patescibacteria group bacterium]|nr:MAG: uracil-DNA glycosylase [Patescibacteria group bacterium]